MDYNKFNGYINFVCMVKAITTTRNELIIERDSISWAKSCWNDSLLAICKYIMYNVYF